MPRTSRFVLAAGLAVAVPLGAQADDTPATTAAPGGTAQRVIVTGTREGEENYRVDSVASVGPLGTTALLDTPYAVSVLSQDLIKNSQATNFKDVSKYLPLVAYQEQQGPEILRPMTRGMQGGNFQNSRLDGMMVFITVATALEQFQQIEVVNGVSASLYGPANPSGMFNFVSKRPTDTDLREFGLSYASDSIVTAHADLGGRLDPNGVLSFRFNGLYGVGDGYVDGSHQRRALGDLGLDLRAWEHGVLEFNFSAYQLTDTGYPGWFTYGEAIQLPEAPDPTRVGYGQSYAGVDMTTRMGSVRLRQELGGDWHLVLGILNQDAARNINTPVNNLTSNAGAYTSSFGNGFAPRFVMTSDAGYLNGRFATGTIEHDLTLGTAGYKAQSYSVTTPATPASVLLGTASIADPVVLPEPVAGPPNVLLSYDSSITYQQGVNVGDTLKFSEAWLARAAISQDWFHVNNLNKTGVQTSEYANSGVSPTGSLMFKPQASMTVYATYASSLQAGDLAPGTAANAGTSLAPYRSKEYELGYKAHLAAIDLTAAVFRIERPFANIDPSDNVFKISGQQVNKGVEFSVVGNVLENLMVVGGVTLLDARLEHTPLVSTNDQHYVGTAKLKGNVLVEYNLPAVAGLALSLDYQFSGARPGNDSNSFEVAGYNLIDLGARYTQTVRATPVTWRLAITNLTDQHYWSTISPSNLTGTNTGNLIAHLGAPRLVLASVGAQF